jgi:hypothetical protein
VKEGIKVAIKDIPIIPLVKHVQEKIEGAAERSILSGALVKQRVHDLSIAKQEQAARDNPDNRKII